MGDLIDARYIINRITEERRRWGDDYDVEQVLGDIEDAPTIDAVEVVRCKDCKNWNTVFDRDKAEYGLCRNFTQLEAKRKDDFCSRAERKDDGYNLQTGGD